jgi:hypothetical protein
LARLIYFFKTPLTGGTFGYGYAERILALGDRFRAESVAVPVPTRSDGGWALRSRRLPDRECSGHWYRAPMPEWFETDTAPAVTPGGADRLRRRAARLLCTTPLGPLCAHPEVRRALAQDRLAAELAPALLMPDFLTYEDALLRDWAEARPEAAAEADAAAAAITATMGRSDAVTRNWRRRIRRAALRRIDASALGREIFAPCPSLLGQPYAPLPAPGGWEIKAGTVQQAHYWPTPESAARSRAARSDPELVQAFERGLCPWLPPEGGEGEFARALAAWIALAPLRAFESQSPFPLFPYRLSVPAGTVPPGFSVRIQPGTLAEQGGSYDTLAAAGLCPYIAEVFQAYAATQVGRLESWAADLPALVAAKWGPFLREAPAGRLTGPGNVS